jgi:hypothetical protein
LFLYMREIVLERQPMSSVRASESQKS